MTSGPIPPLLLLTLLGGLVNLDERGLFVGVVRTPVLVGTVTGWILGNVALGLAVGLVFALLWPAPFRSGGHRAPSPGIAALVGTSAVLAPSSVPTTGSLSELLARTGGADLFGAVVVGAAAALVHQRAESGLRARLGGAAASVTSAAARQRAWVEAVALGSGLGAAGLLIGETLERSGLGTLRTDLAGEGGGWPWVVAAAVLGVSSQLGRTRGSAVGVRDWVVGLLLGVVGTFVLGSAW